MKVSSYHIGMALRKLSEKGIEVRPRSSVKGFMEMKRESTQYANDTAAVSAIAARITEKGLVK